MSKTWPSYDQGSRFTFMNYGCTLAAAHICPRILNLLLVQLQVLLNTRQPPKWFLCRDSGGTKSKQQSKSNEGRHQMCLTPSLGSCWSLLDTDSFMVNAIMSVSSTDCKSIIPGKVLSTDEEHRDVHTALAHTQIDRDRISLDSFCTD